MAFPKIKLRHNAGECLPWLTKYEDWELICWSGWQLLRELDQFREGCARELILASKMKAHHTGRWCKTSTKRSRRLSQSTYSGILWMSKVPMFSACCSGLCSGMMCSRSFTVNCKLVDFGGSYGKVSILAVEGIHHKSGLNYFQLSFAAHLTNV